MHFDINTSKARANWSHNETNENNNSNSNASRVYRLLTLHGSLFCFYLDHIIIHRRQSCLSRVEPESVIATINKKYFKIMYRDYKNCQIDT